MSKWHTMGTSVRTEPYDAFPDKKQALELAHRLKHDSKYPVQHVKVVKTTGRLKWLVRIGGHNSQYW